MTGVMQGNWDAVVLAYALTFGAMGVYLASVLVRVRSALLARDRADEQEPT